MVIGLVWFAANVALIVALRARGGRERAIVSFPGAWILVGVPLTLSFGTSAILFGTGLWEAMH